MLRFKQELLYEQELRYQQELLYPAEASASDSAGASDPAESSKSRSGRSLLVMHLVFGETFFVNEFMRKTQVMKTQLCPVY